METLSTVLPIILYILTSLLVIILIVLGIKLIRTIDKVNDLADDVVKKVNSLNSFFGIMDMITDKLSFLSDKLVDSVASLITKVFIRKDKRKDENNE
ncbi:MAG: hypothetical protein IJO32_02735 [Bacilli bacterium]|nr:hypothetical protein [Bacilli bacterium]